MYFFHPLQFNYIGMSKVIKIKTKQFLFRSSNFLNQISKYPFIL